RKDHGFTLLELMAALAVFAVMATMAYGGLGSLVQTRQEAHKRSEELASLRSFFLFFARDVEQSLPRGILDGTRTPRAPFVGNDGAERFLELTRGGRPNPRGLARSSLERVEYALEEGKIIRRAWPVLDRVQEEIPKGEVVLEEVAEVEIRFLSADGKWRGNWPPTPAQAGVTQPQPSQPGGQPSQPGASGGGMGQTALQEMPPPPAVEIVVLKKGWGRIRRVFEIAGGVG
ncbi:MAG: type II secretion system minor pseudopilin GspJ, partial [Magnetococcales bacterium]|nr:type II secretion system minor pseudopilin GspJ [Magnetococcales bacterium]